MFIDTQANVERTITGVEVFGSASGCFCSSFMLFAKRVGTHFRACGPRNLRAVQINQIAVGVTVMAGNAEWVNVTAKTFVILSSFNVAENSFYKAETRYCIFCPYAFEF
jgi:hypothetical protein